MNAENQVKEGRLKRWLDVALLASTLTSPFVNALLKRLRQREQSAQTVQEKKQAAQPDIRQRLEELTLESQQWVAEQAQQLSKQARQLQAQSRHLRKALRREARQRRKLLVQMRKSGVGRGQDLLKRGERLTEGLVERGGKITQDLLALGGKAAQDLTERSGGFAQELTAQSGKVTHELTKRGEHLLEPLRKRGRNFWTIGGFIAGLLAAGIVTYLLVRRRMAQQVSEEDERIELPPSESWSGSQSRPVGEILHLDPRGATVATLEVVDVEETERPADAGFVGVVSTKQYYPIAMTPEAQDLVYFPSEEEARAQGFTAAE
jgi:hypothetical protein